MIRILIPVIGAGLALAAVAPASAQTSARDYIANLQAACDSGDAEGCRVLGLMNYKGEGGITADRPRGLALLVKACDGGKADGCLVASLMLEHGEGVPRDLNRAATLAIKGCDLGDAMACSLAGTAVFGGYPGPVDVVRAVSYWKKACDANFAKACFELGVVYRNGEGGLPRDQAKAYEMAARACTLGDERGCKVK